MTEFFNWLVSSFHSISDLLDQYSFNVLGLNVSILDIFIGFFAMSIVITVFWKGART